MNSRSQNFFDNDDELEIDFTKFNSKNFSDGENEKSMDDFDGTGINKTVSDNVEDNGYTGVSFDNSEPFVQSAVSDARETDEYAASAGRENHNSDYARRNYSQDSGTAEKNFSAVPDNDRINDISSFRNNISEQNVHDIQNSETASFDLENFSMEGAEKETTIYREIKDGYVIQKTVIIEKKKKPVYSVPEGHRNFEQKNFNTGTVPEGKISSGSSSSPVQNRAPAVKNFSETLNQGFNVLDGSGSIDDPKNQEAINLFSQKDFKIDESDIETSEHEEFQSDAEEPGIFKKINSFAVKTAHRLFLFTLTTLIAVLAIFIIYAVLKPSGTDEFKTIIGSLEPIKKQVEQCIVANPATFQTVCNSNSKADDGSWDLSNRFISENKYDSIANIVIDGGTITVNSNYNASLKGANYILIPQLSPNQKVSWSVSNQSTCFTKHLC